MQGFMKKLGFVALGLGFAAMLLGSTGCSGHGKFHRPGWIIPSR